MSGTRALHSLPIFVRLTGAPVMLIGDGDAANAKRRILERAGATIVGEDARAPLAIVAIDDEEAAVAAVARLKSRGILVNAVDRLPLCDFTLPAIVDRDPVLIAIGTGGASAGLAKALRQRLEALVPERLGIVARTMASARSALRVRFPEPAARRKAIDSVLAPGGALDLFGDGVIADDWIDALAAGVHAHIETIAIASDDPDDLTLRQARLLAGADRIFHDAAVPPAILMRARADAPRIEGKPPVDPGTGLTLVVVRA